LDGISAHGFEFLQGEGPGAVIHDWAKHPSECVWLTLAASARAGTAKQGEGKIGFKSILKRKGEFITDHGGVFQDQIHLERGYPNPGSASTRYREFPQIGVLSSKDSISSLARRRGS
jgi:hypothetical protein